MEFLEANQIEEWLGEIGVVIDADWPVEHRGYYADGRRSGDEPRATADLLAGLGPWDECLVWIRTWGVWASGEDWPAFYAWRGELGERRSLDKAPGHRFARSDRSLLSEVLVLIMENAWDADVFCARAGRAHELSAHISHDEWYEIRRRIDC